jgi:flagellar basal body-associated protein FliL
MSRRPKDAIEKRLWVTLIVLLVLLVGVAMFIAWLGG